MKNRVRASSPVSGCWARGGIAQRRAEGSQALRGHLAQTPSPPVSGSWGPNGNESPLSRRRGPGSFSRLFATFQIWKQPACLGSGCLTVVAPAWTPVPSVCLGHSCGPGAGGRAQRRLDSCFSPPSVTSDLG